MLGQGLLIGYSDTKGQGFPLPYLNGHQTMDIRPGLKQQSP